MRWIMLGLAVALGVIFILPFIRKSSEATSDWAKRQQDINDDGPEAPVDLSEIDDPLENAGQKRKAEVHDAKKDKADKDPNPHSKSSEAPGHIKERRGPENKD
jgi:hypothetical protein